MLKKSLILLAIVFVFVGCKYRPALVSTSSNTNAQSSPSMLNKANSDSLLSSEPDMSSSVSSSETYSFTNSYGASDTICNHSGCTNYIAASGDTNCCPIHSSKCLNCNKYIDEDAIYCMDCLKKSIQSSSSPSSKPKKSNYSSKSSSSSTKAGGYDMPNENDKSFSDYVKRVDPDLYNSLFS